MTMSVSRALGLMTAIGLGADNQLYRLALERRQ
jgi:hypothetical protein